MAERIVCCGVPGCPHPAAYKIAAPWYDGDFFELKTYGLACASHLGPSFRHALRRRRTYPPALGEIVGPIGIYCCDSGRSCRRLERLWGLEQKLGRVEEWGLVVSLGA